MAAFDDLKAEVEATKAGEDSAIVLLNGLHQALVDLAAQFAGTPAAADIAALATDLASKRNELAAAVAADPVP